MVSLATLNKVKSMSLKQNKSWQFLVGCFVLFCAYKIYSLGIIDAFMNAEVSYSPSEGFESTTALLPLLLTAVVSAVQMVGIIAIALVSGLQPLAEMAVDALRSKMPKFNTVATKVEQNIDVDKLVDALNQIDERIRSIEVKVGSDETK